MIRVPFGTGIVRFPPLALPQVSVVSSSLIFGKLQWVPVESTHITSSSIFTSQKKIPEETSARSHRKHYKLNRADEYWSNVIGQLVFLPRRII